MWQYRHVHALDPNLQRWQSLLITQYNLLLLGRIGAGKATLVDHITETTSMSSHRNRMTSDPVSNEAWIPSPHNVHYNVKILDTSDMRGFYNEGRGIAGEIEKYFCETQRSGKSNAALVLFVVSHAWYIDEEWGIFRDILQSCGESLNLHAGSALVMTNCEDLHDEAREELVGQIRRSDLTADIAKFMGKGIHPVGFPDFEKLKPGMRELYTDGIKKDEETLRRLFCERGKWQPPNDISVHGSSMLTRPSAMSSNRGTAHCTVS